MESVTRNRIVSPELSEAEKRQVIRAVGYLRKWYNQDDWLKRDLANADSPAIRGNIMKKAAVDAATRAGLPESKYNDVLAKWRSDQRPREAGPVQSAKAETDQADLPF